VVSFDGRPSPNYYNDVWIPWAIKIPLLAQLAIHTSACYQAEFLRIPVAQYPVAIKLKLKSIALLNEIIRCKERCTSDEAIAGVMHLITSEVSIFTLLLFHFAPISEVANLSIFFYPWDTQAPILRIVSFFTMTSWSRNTNLTNLQWYWGKREVVEAHMKGLNEMIRLRGGLRTLESSPLVYKLVIL
jgi:hypothetical protein